MQRDIVNNNTNVSAAFENFILHLLFSLG